ncbi:uncharacterized protein BT62DRAFT_1079852 [Guyanagaster necrorhizus]|uniref:F-box domain-containing protein n=1 Tax=Guyanagaster necrorhizus TaxID=856835 RepID=A0A9P8ANC5_9AGAR|nr:uncharacterized protein BT62DRAFT_1079852 [Guyanagaster necrorhizus MCA 3950]KAG7441679.1 hypothetical protein BT62DRAFT_1079852 [Guyanagaster necrorhizus MCA 3950]
MPCSFCGTLPGLPAIPSVTQQFRSPRLKRLLSQNEPPLETERSTLRETITTGTAAVSLLDDRILKAQRLLDTFINKREQVKLCIDDARSLLHPIRSINDDLLREIFLWCVYDWVDVMYHCHGNCDSLCPLEPPWTLSHVSHRWRTISLSSPCLWTSVILNFSIYSELMIPYRYIMFNPSDLGHAGRQLVQMEVKSLSGNLFSRLDTLIVRIEARRMSPARNMKIDTFQSASQLRCFQTINDADPSRILLLPWSNLTRYKCSDALSPNNIAILPQLTSVKTLIFYFKSDPKTPTGGAPIVMSSVIKLNVYELSKLPEDAISRLFDSVTFPSATYVNINFKMDHDRIPRFPMLAVCGKLETLRLRLNVSSDQNVRALLECLKAVDSVAHLQLCIKVVPDALLNGFVISPQSHHILPNLQTLTLHLLASTGVADFTPAVLFRFAERTPA